MYDVQVCKLSHIRFEGPDGPVDLVPKFICCMWLGYLAKMRGHPSPSAKSSQLVLKYLLVNDALVVKAWRSRVYRYSSGTQFAESTVELQEYLNELDDPMVLRRVGFSNYRTFIACLPTCYTCLT